MDDPMPDPPRWREDFPPEWESDHYISRRELAKFLALGGALLVGANALLAVLGPLRKHPAGPALAIPGAASLAPGSSLLFRYPTAEDPCVLVRTRDGVLTAFSQVCTHLSCAVVYREQKGEGGEQLFCPCHHGAFSCREGLPIAGPPTRRLPSIRLERRGDDVWAVGVDV